jgi:hypothetical protein
MERLPGEVALVPITELAIRQDTGIHSQQFCYDRIRNAGPGDPAYEHCISTRYRPGALTWRRGPSPKTRVTVHEVSPRKTPNTRKGFRNFMPNARAVLPVSRVSRANSGHLNSYKRELLTHRSTVPRCQFINAKKLEWGRFVPRQHE